jgi:hypothetical protein
MRLLEIFYSWKTVVAAGLAMIMTGAEWAFGDPTTPDGRGLALVCVLFFVDFLISNVVALLARPVEWQWARFKKLPGKALLWASLLLIARQLSVPVGIMWADPVLRWMSELLIISLAMTDLGSILRHLRRLSAMGNVRTPLLDRAFTLMDAATEKVLGRQESP